jgi:hypothetical protein
VPTGRLRITIDEARQFEDTADQKLESLLNRFFVAAYNSVVRSWRQTRERDAWDRKWAEQERQQREAERVREEARRIAADEQKRRAALLTEATQ